MKTVGWDTAKAMGKTPMVRLHRLAVGLGAEVYVKLECRNPFGSIKDRVAWAMVMDAQVKGVLRQGSVIIEPTSGNTGIALAGLAAVNGYRLIVTIPGKKPRERYALLKALGAEVVVTPSWRGMRGAIERAEQMARQLPQAVLLQQFRNPANVTVHRQTTGQEIWQDMDGQLDIFVAGVGTGGTVTGVTQALKARRPDIRSVAVLLDDFVFLSSKATWLQKILGGVLEADRAVFDPDIVDAYMQVPKQDIDRTIRRLALEEGILAGTSGGAAVCASCALAARPENKGKRIVTILPDSGERYLSIWPKERGSLCRWLLPARGSM